MSTNEDLQGVSNCYVFKSRLQEYAQKAGLHTPVYETVKEGPSHEPSFRSTVTLNDVRYDSLSGFFNRKAAEQSAAEVALVELAKSGEVNQSITQPVHETGLCKNLLQEYAQKMNYAMPMYICKKDETPGRTPFFSCTVDIGGIHYIGGSAKTKKEAEIKAARTALLAIQSNPSHASENQVGNLTVIPSKKRAAESVAGVDETSNAPKPKKARFKRKYSKRKFSRNKKGRIHADNASSEANINNGVESQATVTDESGLQEIKSEAAFPSEAIKNFENGVSTADHEKETLVGEGYFAQKSQGVSENGNSQAIVTDESGLQEIKSEAAFPAEAIKNFENEVSIADHEKETVVGEGSFAQKSQGGSENGNSQATVTNESGLQEIKSEAAFPSEVMKNFENGVSTADHEKETLVGEGSIAEKSQGVLENGNSQATVTDESGLQETKSEAAFLSEAIKNFENRVSTADHEKETLVGEGSFAQKSQGVSENGISQATIITDESGLQEIKSEAVFPSEAIKNFENGVSTDHEKDTLAGECSFALKGQGVSENGKSTELVFKEDNIVTVAAEASSLPNGDTGLGVEATVPNGDTGLGVVAGTAPNVDTELGVETATVPNEDTGLGVEAAT